MNSSLAFTTLVEYRDIKLSDDQVISTDSKEVFVGLQGLGVKPVRSMTDGKKLIIHFVKSEALPSFQKIQQSLAGVLAEPLLVDFNQISLAEGAWKGQLTMMRNVPITKA